MPYRGWLAPVALLCFASSPVIAAAQEPTPSQGPPKVLQIFVESVKPGKGPAHEKVEAGWPAAFRKAKWPTHYLGMTSTTGPGEAWFLSGYDSYAALETDQQNVGKNAALSKELDRLSGVDGELLTGTRGMVATYRPDLSYRPEVDMGTMRYFALIIVTLKPGYDSAYADVRKVVNAGHEKANLDEHWAMYQVTSGGAGGMYLLFIPMKSLQEADQAEVNHGKPYQDALGESGRQQLRDFARNGMASSESKLFSFSPKMSYPPQEWVAKDPQYWAPKAVAAGKP